MASFMRSYNSALLRRPMLTQCITAAVLFGAGDIVAQQAIEKQGNKHDVKPFNPDNPLMTFIIEVFKYLRTARITFYGGCIFGPIMTKWYQWLGNIKFRTPTTAVITRVGLDQAVLTPVAVAFFFSSMTFLEGKGVKDARQRIESAYYPTLLRNWGVFIPTQILNFSVVPPHLRFGVVGVVSLFWNSYLSYANARQTTGKQPI